jgi:signal transduction histidine kinase
MPETQASIAHYTQAITAATMSAGFTHTARKYIAGIEVALRRLAEQRKVREDRELSALVRSAGQEFAELIHLFDRMNEVFRGGPPRFESCDLKRLIREVKLHMRALMEERTVRFRSDFEDSPFPRVEVDPASMKVVLINLVKRSIEAGARQVVLSARVSSQRDVTEAERTVVKVSVEDDGRGIPEEHWERAFDLGLSLIEEPRTGFALAVCRHILHEHSGVIHIDSSVAGQGTKISLVWPIHINR